MVADVFPRSFPRKREPRITCSILSLSLWVPAFARTSGRDAELYFARRARRSSAPCRMKEAAIRVARRDSDGFGPEVEPDQRSARRQQRRNLNQWQDRHGRGLSEP